METRMSAEQPKRRPGEGLVPWIPFAAISIALHAGWWLLVPAGSAMPEPRERAAPPAFAYAGGTAASGGDLLAVWSPVLFSVPTRMGFSAPLLADVANLTPPQNPNPAAPVLAERGSYQPPAAGPGPHARLTSSISSLVVRAVSAPAFAPRKSSTNILLHILWTDQRGTPRYQSVDVGGADPWTDRKPWEAQAVLELSEQGSVNHVFLEKPTTSKDRNAALVRILSALNMGPHDMARFGRVTVRFEGVASAEAPVEP